MSHHTHVHTYVRGERTRARIYLMVEGCGAHGHRHGLRRVWNLPLSYVFIRVFLVRPCCRCQALLPRYGVQTTVSSYRMVHRGVSVTYTLFGYPRSSAPPHVVPLSPTALSRRPRPYREPGLSLSLCCGSCRTVDPATKMFCKTQRLYLHARPSEKPHISSEATLIDAARGGAPPASLALTSLARSQPAPATREMEIISPCINRQMLIPIFLVGGESRKVNIDNSPSPGCNFETATNPFA